MLTHAPQGPPHVLGWIYFFACSYFFVWQSPNARIGVCDLGQQKWHVPTIGHSSPKTLMCRARSAEAVPHKFLCVWAEVCWSCSPLKAFETQLCQQVCHIKLKLLPTKPCLKLLVKSTKVHVRWWAPSTNNITKCFWLHVVVLKLLLRIWCSLE